MLYNDGRVGDEGPEIVGLHSRVALEIFKECRLISVVVGIYRKHGVLVANGHVKYQDQT